MLQSLQTSKRVRKNFGKIKLVASIPNLIEIQKNELGFNYPTQNTLMSQHHKVFFQ
jgi:hypothetical protein